MPRYGATSDEKVDVLVLVLDFLGRYKPSTRTTTRTIFKEWPAGLANGYAEVLSSTLRVSMGIKRPSSGV